MKIVAIVSGGLDSVTMAHMLKRNDQLDLLLTFNYGQRHAREIEYAEHAALKLDVPYRLVDLRSLKNLLAGSALTDETVPVPEGHYEAESMRLTVVPNRNAIMLAIATAAAVTRQADAIAFAAHAGDHAIYPDCRPAFVSAFEVAMDVGNKGFLRPNFEVIAPFLSKSKADIVTLGHTIGVPFAKTWSCYKGGDLHCGVCGTCVERREAFADANVHDPTVYADPREN